MGIDTITLDFARKESTTMKKRVLNLVLVVAAGLI